VVAFYRGKELVPLYPVYYIYDSTRMMIVLGIISAGVSSVPGVPQETVSC